MQPRTCKVSKLPPEINAFVERMRECGFRVWLIGSRANGTETARSDWDLLVFGDANLLDRLGQEQAPEKADVLVVYDQDAFRSPWSRDDGQFNQGSLKQWGWTETSTSEATYMGTKWPDDWGSVRCAKCLTP